MKQAVLVVQTNPVSSEQEDAFNSWYDRVHVPDVLKLPGFVAARRYRISDVQLAGSGGDHRYLALYELETDDLVAARDALVKAASDGSMEIHEALDMAKASSVLFEAIGPRQTESRG